ncbi:MAG: FMN-binding protein [Clostridia bacterium]|nr:FMN-binding protein [Clostridia bacterium]
MKNNIKSVISLTAICIVTSILLAFTNNLTAPIIAKQEAAAVNDALTVVLPNGEDFQSVDITKYTLPSTITEAYSEKNGGYVFKMETTGYDVGFVILCGIDKDGVVKGATSISSKETLGYEKSYGDELKDKTLGDIDTVATVAGATKTTAAYKSAIKDALNSFVILNGGTADLRSEEEILADNLNTALPEANGEFEIVLILEEINGIDTIYKSVKNNGFVFVIGEEFIGTDSDGNILTETSETNKTIIENARQTLLKWADSQIDLTKLTDMPTSVEAAYKADNGNYTLILHAAGYGINGGDKYHPASGEPIVIKVTASKDGKIITCKTLEQNETANIGSACADESFYSQFNGKTENDYTEIDAISGATLTTDGYKNAIGDVFTAIKILKGVS